MSEKKLYMNRLIHGVTHLCERTRELARTPSPDPLALMPVRECLDIIERTLDSLGHALEPRAPFPSGPAAPVETSWLVGVDDVD